MIVIMGKGGSGFPRGVKEEDKNYGRHCHKGKIDKEDVFLFGCAHGLSS